jgi:hypothetical protein
MWPGVLGVGDVEAGRGEGVGAPDVGEGAAAAVRHPDAGILRVPAAVGHRIAAAGLGRAQRLAVGGGRAAAAHDLDVGDQRGRARPPQQRRGARVDAAGEQADARQDVVAALRASPDRRHRTDAGVARIVVGDDQLGQGRVQADQHGVGPQLQGVGDHVEADRQIEHAVGVDRLLQGGGVVGRAVALHAQRLDVGPVGHRRQGAQGGRVGRRQAGSGVMSDLVLYSPIWPRPGSVRP